MCPALPTAPYTRWELDLEPRKRKPFQNKTRIFENMVKSYFQQSDHSVKWKLSTRQVHRKKLTRTVLMVFVDAAILCLELWDAIIIIVHVKKLVHLSLIKILFETFKKGLDELWKQCIQEKCYNVIDMFYCDWWETHKTDDFVKQHLRETFLYKMPFRGLFFRKLSFQEVFLVPFNVILKYPRILEKLLPTFYPSSRIIVMVEITLVRLRKNVPRKKDF